jgi:hypothetical protein
MDMDVDLIKRTVASLRSAGAAFDPDPADA